MKDKAFVPSAMLRDPETIPEVVKATRKVENNRKITHVESANCFDNESDTPQIRSARQTSQVS